MKPWLLNILACPIDKYHPLQANFFSWETGEEELHKIVSEAGQPNIHFKKNYKHLAKQIKDGTISPSSVRNIKDLSGSLNSQSLLATAVDAITRLERVETSEEDLPRDYPEDLDALYRFFNLIEVKEGILYCSKCGRWYPIGSAVETIPEMLPDDLREKDRDITWLKKWSEKIPTQILEEGKPFNTKPD
jgi:uncharacterized protein YbaR (Trm112 family)